MSSETTPLPTYLLHETQLQGEQRINLIRMIALGALYAQHCYNLYITQDPTLTPQFLRIVNLALVGWLLAIAGIQYCLSRRWLPPYLKYGAALWDLTMCTLIITAGDGPHSSLLILLPVVVAASAVRLSRGLVLFSTLGAIVSYLLILGHYVFYRIGSSTYYSTPTLRIPRTQELITLIVLLIAGLLAGQSVRQARHLLTYVTTKA